MKGGKITVFCGSTPGKRGEYQAAALRLGRLLGEQGLGLVYGGGDAGLMGSLSRAAFQAGATVTGVIPEALAGRVSHREISELIVTADMHERKRRMYELGDAFIALPGGIGTLEELAEIATWQQLEFHRKPVGLLNSAGYYDSLLTFLDEMTGEGFLKGPHRRNILADADPERLLSRLMGQTLEIGNKWSVE